MEQFLGIDINTETLLRWLSNALPIAHVIFIVIVALVLRKLSYRVLVRLQERYHVSEQVAMGTYRVLSVLISISAFFLILDRFGVSGTVLWTAFTGFAAVAAVAFFAAWSVLSNIFCTLLIVMVRPFRLYDYVEILENGDKPGLKGQVIDINFIFSTLKERHEDGSETVLQVPNSLFFQRMLRRWIGNSTPYSNSKKKPSSLLDSALDFDPNPVGPVQPKKGKK